MPRGRPKNPEVAYDPAAVQEFIKRLFDIEREINVLRDDKKELSEEFKDKINKKLISKVIRLVKAKIKVMEEKASEETVQELEDMISDKVESVL